MSSVDAFLALLERGSAELYEDNGDQMRSPALIPTSNAIDPGDVDLFFRGLDLGLISLHRGARFNTRDRPTAIGHWALLSRSERGGWYNAEYLPQIAAYVDAIDNLGYPHERVLFELPATALQLDLAILDDHARVMVLGEAKRDTAALVTLREGMLHRFAAAAPTIDSKKRGDEQRQLAWRLWTVRPRLTWLIGPGHREAFDTAADPLRLTSRPHLPPAAAVGLSHPPPARLTAPRLLD